MTHSQASSSSEYPSSDELLYRCANGDREAFQGLYRQLSSRAYGLALRVLHDEHLAQDAVQEGFVQVWTEAPFFDSSLSSGRGWVLGRVHRRAVDRVRREEADRKNARVWGARQLDTAHDSVAEIVEMRSDHRRVRAGLAQLSALQREALELAYFRGLTQKEIAECLGIPLGTAKTRLRDALQHLRQHLEVTS